MKRKIKRCIMSFAVFIVRIVMAVFCPTTGVGVENIPKDRGIVICPNHVSMFDVVCLFLTCPRRIHFMAKAELFNTKIMRVLLDIAEAFPVRRGKGDTYAIEHSVDIVKNNEVLGIFVEGTRTKNPDGSPGRTKPGAVLVASQANCDIIPVGICYKHNKPKLFCRNYVYYGTPIGYDEIKADIHKKSELRASCDLIMSSIVKLWESGKSKWQK